MSSAQPAAVVGTSQASLSAAAGTGKEEAGVGLRIHLVLPRGRQVFPLRNKGLKFRHRDTLLLVLLKVSMVSFSFPVVVQTITFTLLTHIMKTMGCIM